MYTIATTCSIIAVLSLSLFGCGAVNHHAALIGGYVPDPRSRIEVGAVSNATGQVPTVDDQVVNIEQMLGQALTEELARKDLLWTEGGARKIVLASKIIEYEPGDAFKRWLLPGWGSTIVNVECELRDGDLVVGTVRARRTISIGGAYTIGAWRTIFASVADDVVSEVRSKIGR